METTEFKFNNSDWIRLAIFVLCFTFLECMSYAPQKNFQQVDQVVIGASVDLIHIQDTVRKYRNAYMPPERIPGIYQQFASTTIHTVDSNHYQVLYRDTSHQCESDDKLCPNDLAPNTLEHAVLYSVEKIRQSDGSIAFKTIFNPANRDDVQNYFDGHNTDLKIAPIPA